MQVVESQRSVRSEPVLPLSARLGAVRIAVTDRQKALAIWREVVGLELMEEEDRLLRLGAGGRVLVELDVAATRPVVKNTVGLYHVAIHVPTRADLAQFAMRALQRRVGISPTDHLVSEAIYLWDLDGNGIEITFETPWRGRLGDPDQGAYAVSADGRPHSGREPLDLDGLLGELGENPVPEPRMPPGTRVGHVHVHVRDLDESMEFYRDGIGFGGLFIIRQFGMGDVGLGYPPHIVAFNIWSGGPDAREPPPGAAGLRSFTIVVPSADVLAGVASRLSAMGVAVTSLPEGLETHDPSGNRIRVVVG